MNNVYSRLIPQEDFAAALHRYETRLDRQLTNAFKLLQTLQKSNAQPKQTHRPFRDSSGRPYHPSETNPISPFCHPGEGRGPVSHGKNEETNPIPSSSNESPGPKDPIIEDEQKRKNEPNSPHPHTTQTYREKTPPPLQSPDDEFRELYIFSG